MSYLVQYRNNSLKKEALNLRKRGLSYAEIQKTISVSKGTLSRWFQGVHLTEEQLQRLVGRRRAGSVRGLKTRLQNARERNEHLIISAANNIKTLSSRELWLMGIMLMWCERFGIGDEAKLRQGVKFSSARPDLIQFFILWLRKIGGLADHEIQFSIFLRADQKETLSSAMRYWSRVTGFRTISFSRSYFQKTQANVAGLLSEQQLKIQNLGQSVFFKKQKPSTKKPVKRARFGFLQIRVQASSMLARQISGWIFKIKNILGID